MEVANNSATQSFYPLIQSKRLNGLPLRQMPRWDRPFIPDGDQGTIERRIAEHLGPDGDERLALYEQHDPEGFKRLLKKFRRDETAALRSEEFLLALQATCPP
jgi:hypothetical protein